MAAGLGFKTFTTGEVLTAADTNGYLMQGVNVFANAAARTAAITSPQEGQMSYLKDTDSVESYSGSAWVAVGGGATSLGFTAGKNRIINGDFGVNQRNFTSNTANGAFNFDRWYSDQSGGTVTITPQTFTPGAAPVAGYEGRTFVQVAVSGQSGANYASISQKIEDVRTYAGQSVTISFWAKAAAGTPQIYPIAFQRMGTGGSPSAATQTNATAQSISTSWARYSFTISLPSLSGKTLGTNNDSSVELEIMLSGAGVAVNNTTFQIWGVQFEAGSTATAFQTATGTIQGELAACQRYYFRSRAGGGYAPLSGTKGAFSTTMVQIPVYFPVTMRTNPSSIEYSNLVVSDGANAIVPSNIVIGVVSTLVGAADATCSGLTQFRPYTYSDNSTSTGYIAFSAEL